MSKLYKWLAIYILRPYKNFGHLIKCLAIFLARQNKRQKRKNKGKKKRKLTWPKRPNLSPRSPAAGPARQVPCRLPQAARCRACRVQRLPLRRRRRSTPPRASKTCHGDAQDTPHPLPPSPVRLPLSPREFVDAREDQQR